MTTSCSIRYVTAWRGSPTASHSKWAPITAKKNKILLKTDSEKPPRLCQSTRPGLRIAPALKDSRHVLLFVLTHYRGLAVKPWTTEDGTFPWKVPTTNHGCLRASQEATWVWVRSASVEIHLELSRLETLTWTWSHVQWQPGHRRSSSRKTQPSREMSLTQQL